MGYVPAGPDVSAEQAVSEVGRVAREVFGYEELRPGQAEAMVKLLAGHDVLLVMPTGGGKPAAYQIPAVVLRGATVVISPLISLQRDQVEALRGQGEDTNAYPVSSGVSAGERREAWESVEAGDAEFLFLAPEQLANPDVLERIRRLQPSLVAVDEAHSVSSWGHDFRPDYLRLGEFIDAIGHPRVIALTATAAPPVREDIVDRLHMRDVHVVVRGFARPNIALEVIRALSDAEKRKLEQSRVEMMRGYCETQGCRRQFLLAYFAEQLPEPCGNCDTCRAGTAEPAPDMAQAPFALQSRVRHDTFGEGVVMSYEQDPDRVTVLFQSAGYKTLALEALRRNKLMEPVA